MKIESLLEYQNVDTQLWNLEQKQFCSPHKKKAAELSDIAKKSQAKSAQLEAEAEKLNKDLTEIKQKYEINKKKLDEILASDVEEASQEELNKLLALKNKLAQNLNILEKMLQKCAENINRILSDFNKTKRTFDQARAQFALCKEKLDEEAKALEPEKQKLRKQLENLEKGVDGVLMAEYKKKRQDKIFPVFVPLEGGIRCGRCRMELPKAAISKIKEKGVVTCENEHCKRFIYFK